ncbi:MAG: hypothetical protein CM15mP82_4290 [Methanobacteriota archaeon]|nr:MAG: hypothetical protein CM15mP82_4290 [Euryarchaeota archaeon]
MTARFPISAVLKSHFSELYSSNPDYDFHLYDDNSGSGLHISTWGAFLLGFMIASGKSIFLQNRPMAIFNNISQRGFILMTSLVLSKH